MIQSSPVQALKETAELPDFYTMTLHYKDGTSRMVEAVKSVVYPETMILEILSKKNTWLWIPMDSVKEIELDENFAKIAELSEKRRLHELQLKKGGA